MSSAVLSNAAALRRPFIFDAEAEPQASSTTHGGTANPGCPVERSSTAMSVAPLLPDVVRHDSRARLSPHEHLIPSIHNQRFPPASITPASQLEVRPAPEMVSSGIPELDALTGGLPRGCLTEICGPASSGRTTVLLAALAAATRRGEFCALIDASDALDPHSLAASGIALDRLLWVRCGESSPQSQPSTSLRTGSGTEKNKKQETGTSPQVHGKFDRNHWGQSEHRLEQVLRATDLLLESGGFGLIVLDLADLPPQAARRIPLTTWFRFRRAVEHKPTILLAIEPQPIAGSCSSLLLQLGAQDSETSVSKTNYLLDVDNSGEPAAKRRKNAAHGASRGLTAEDVQAPEGRIIHDGEQSTVDFQFAHPSHAHLFTGLKINVELIRSRLERKPARSITFATKTAWVG